MFDHQAIKQPDREKTFQNAIEKELAGHHLKADTIIQIAERGTASSPIWQLRHKRITKTGEISKWKARLCTDGSRQKQGIHYEEAYAPVVSWGATKCILMLAAINYWRKRQLDYFMIFTHANVKRVLYMEPPKDFSMPG